MPVYKWDTDKRDIVDRLRSTATLKLCVKVRDEPLLIESWIRHHGNIVGFENLVVADNGSTDAETLSVYDRYGEAVTIFQFDGPHNDIHWHPRFLEFFEIIKRTCTYFSFIDVDERLVWIDHNSWVADGSIVEKIAACSDRTSIIPTTWLINTLNSFDTFSLLDTEANPHLKNNLRWGKPLLPAHLVGLEVGIHNDQFDRFVFSTDFGVSLFLLHFTQFPYRRISVNRNKLISRGVVGNDVTSEDIVAMSFDGHPDASVARFVAEMKKMYDVIERRADRLDLAGLDYVQLTHDGRVRYSNDRVRNDLSKFLDDGPGVIELMLGRCDLGADRTNDADSLLKLAIELRTQGSGTRAEKLFRQGMALYPDLVDQYGGPAFRKELMRMYLARRDWSGAEALSPSEGDLGGLHWHRVLFARAFSEIGDKQKAEQWWKAVLEQDPNDGEAQNHLQSLLEPSTLASVPIVADGRPLPSTLAAHNSDAGPTPGGETMLPRMSRAELTLFESFVRCSDNYLEFGSGGSTCVAATLVRESLTSLDSSREWLEAVRKKCLALDVGIKLQLVHVDLGPTGDWGSPAENARDRWPSYYSDIWANPTFSDADLYFIDGRFRVACFMQALLHCGPDSFIMIHDFSSRSYYHVVREVAREIACAEDLSVFQPYRGRPKERVQAILRAHMYDCS
jgi:hypothetical protein